MNVLVAGNAIGMFSGIAHPCRRDTIHVVDMLQKSKPQNKVS